MIDTVSIRFIEYTNHTRVCGAVTNTSCLFLSIDSLDRVGLNKVENRIVFCRSNGVTKHALSIVMIQLKVF